jgi:O-antigen/teichoic acid export membrane protein
LGTDSAEAEDTRVGGPGATGGTTAGPRPVSGGRNVRDGSVVLVARLVAQASQFATVLMAARFMSPADFGIFAVLSAVAVGLTRFSEAGWREFIMTCDDDQTLAETNALVLLCGVGSFLAGGMAALAMAALGQSTAGVMAVMAVWVLLTTVSAAQAGLLVHRGQLSYLATAQIVGELAGLMAAAAVFWAGGTLIGLAAAKLVTQAIIFALSLMATRWFRLASPRGAGARAAIVFSRRILATRLIGYAQENLSLFAIGAFVGPAGAGLFRAAGRLSGALLELVSEPLRLVAWSVLRHRQGDDRGETLLVVAVTAATPLFLGLAITAPDAVSLLLGPGWGASAPLLTAFALAGWLTILNAATEPLLSLSGRSAVLPRLSLALTGINLASLVLAAPFGLLAIAVGQLVAAFITLPIVVWAQHRFGGISPLSLLRGLVPALSGAAALVAAVVAARVLLPPELSLPLRLGAQAAIGGLAYAAIVGFALRSKAASVRPDIAAWLRTLRGRAPS